MPSTSDLLSAAQSGFSALAVREETRQEALAHLRRWLTEASFSPYQPMIRALVAAQRWDLLLDSFYQVLPFGTGGRRGPVGIGPNRYNPWTLGASVQGHATWLRARVLAADPARDFAARPLHIVVAYDVRRYLDAGGTYAGIDAPNACMGLSSRDFAELACGVYAANGVHTTILPRGSTTFVSTPELSFAIRHLRADGGLNISASHNPPDDNGGKFYNALGGQEVPPNDETMAQEVDRVGDVSMTPFESASAFVHDYAASIHDGYVAVNQTPTYTKASAAEKAQLHVVFTALHGTGDTTVVEVLRAAGYRVTLEPTQASHDGAFPNVPFRAPNPEVRPSMAVAVSLAEQLGADLVMACDPDADRIGLWAREAVGGAFRFFSGNEIAVLCAEHIGRNAPGGGATGKGIVMKTEVTTDLVRRVAEHHGYRTVNHLMVGFKYIGDGIHQLESTGAFAGLQGSTEDFALGVEESHGVLVTTAMRDKDAAGAARLLAEMAVDEAAGRFSGGAPRTLYGALTATWEARGYVQNELVSTVMRGAAGKATIDRIQASIRANPPTVVGGLDVTSFADRADPAGPLGAIKSGTDAASRDVLVFQFGDRARILLRPSGTEPKNKIYVELCGEPGEPLDAAVPRVAAAAKALARAFTQVMLARVDIHLPGWALLVSDLVAIEQKRDFAERFVPGLVERLDDGGVQAWIDQELRAYGKDGRGLVRDALAAWASGQGDVGVRAVRALG